MESPAEHCCPFLPIASAVVMEPVCPDRVPAKYSLSFHVSQAQNMQGGSGEKTTKNKTLAISSGIFHSY